MQYSHLLKKKSVIFSYFTHTHIGWSVTLVLKRVFHSHSCDTETTLCSRWNHSRSRWNHCCVAHGVVTVSLILAHSVGIIVTLALTVCFYLEVFFRQWNHGFTYFRQSFTLSLCWNFLLFVLLICWYLCLLFNVFSMSVILLFIY